ncbi:MAG: hypothetical protein ACREBU_09865 [Nitrososphaera sp.]
MSRLNMDLNKDDDNKLDALKREFGIRQTSELIRFLISYQYRNVTKTAPTGTQ